MSAESKSPMTDAEVARVRKILDGACKDGVWPVDRIALDEGFCREVEIRLGIKIEELQEWKRQQLAVESQWDEQRVGKLLGLQLGTQIRPQIEPAIVQLQKHLGNLLARIHGDGGHYQDEHGVEKAVADADLKFCEMQRQIEELKQDKAILDHIEECQKVAIVGESKRTFRQAILDEMRRKES